MEGRSGTLSRVFLFVLSGATFWVLVAHVSDLRQAGAIVLRAEPLLIGAALLLQGAAYLSYAAAYQASLGTLGISTRLGWTAAIYIESLLAAILIPAGTIALFLASLREQGQPTSRATLGLLFARLADLLTYCALFTLSLVYLAACHHVEQPTLSGAAMTIGITLALLAALGLLACRPRVFSPLLRTASGLAASVSRLARRRSPFQEARVLDLCGQLQEAAATLARQKSGAARALLWTLGSHLADLLTLAALFAAFGHPVPAPVLLLGFLLGRLFFVIPITPQGIGVVEGTMIFTYQRAGVPLEVAAVVTVAFRGVSFWLPAVLGAVLLEVRTGRNLLRHASEEGTAPPLAQEDGCVSGPRDRENHRPGAPPC